MEERNIGREGKGTHPPTCPFVVALRGKKGPLPSPYVICLKGGSGRRTTEGEFSPETEVPEGKAALYPN